MSKKVKRMYKVEFNQLTPQSHQLKPYTCSAPSAQNAARKAVRYWTKEYHNKWQPSFNNAEVTIL